MNCKTYDKDGRLLTVCHNLADAEARLAEAERDAARYRWIHDHVEYVHGTGFVLELHPDADGPSRFQWGVDAAMKIAAQQITHNFGADDDGFCDSCGEPEDAAVHRHRTPDSADAGQSWGVVCSYCERRYSKALSQCPWAGCPSTTPTVSAGAKP